MGMYAEFTLIPLVQVGYSYYLSVQVLLAVVALYNIRRNLWFVLARDFIPKLAIASSMYLSLLSRYSVSFADDFLRITREALCFIIILSILRGESAIARRLDGRQLMKIGFILVGLFASLAVIQSAILGSGIYGGIPKEYFIANDNTLPDELALIYSVVRPMGTFGEPSYFGFILICLFVMYYPFVWAYRSAILIMLLVIWTGIMTHSLAFVASLFGIAGIILYQNLRQHRLRWAGVAILPCIFLIGYLVIPADVLGRFTDSNVIENDASTYVRIIGPVNILGTYLSNYPFGVPIAGAAEAITKIDHASAYIAEEYFHNGIFDIFFSYGIFGAAMLLALLWASSDNIMRVFIILVGSFNGAFLAVDKMALICITVGIYGSGKAYRRSGLPKWETAIVNQSMTYPRKKS
jgi:hypothetical protein